MPEATQETQVAEDLDQRVETLLKQMETAADQAAGIVAETEALAGAVAVAEPPGAPAAAAEADLASQVDQLLAAAAKTTGDSSAPEAPQSIGSLDEELAKIASDLMEGDVEGEATPVPVAGAVSAPSPAPQAAPSDPTIGEAPVLRPQSAPAPAPALQTPTAPPTAPLWRRVAAVVVAVVTATAAAVHRHTPTLLAFLEPIAFRLAALISMPLRNRPALVRDAVGWVALGTTFWASCLFAYFLFLYEPDAPHPTSAAVGLTDPSHPEPEAEHEPAKAEHKEEASPEHGGGGEGGHGDAKKKEEPQPALKRPDKDPLNRPAEKPAKKEGGGHEPAGEHH